MAISSCPTLQCAQPGAPIAKRVPRCPRCKSNLPWVVDGATGTFTAETTATVPVVVDFSAARCGPCRILSPVLEEPAKRQVGHLKVVKVDVDANPGLATRFGAQSIPLLVVTRDGQEVDELSARFLALRWSSDCGQCLPLIVDPPRTSANGASLQARSCSSRGSTGSAT